MIDRGLLELDLQFRMQLGGPSWTVLLGRRDSTASKDNAERDLLAPSFDLANLTPSHLQTSSLFGRPYRIVDYLLLAGLV